MMLRQLNNNLSLTDKAIIMFCDTNGLGRNLSWPIAKHNSYNKLPLKSNVFISSVNSMWLYICDYLGFNIA
jgi:hypothetical protein